MKPDPHTDILRAVIWALAFIASAAFWGAMFYIGKAMLT